MIELADCRRHMKTRPRVFPIFTRFDMTIYYINLKKMDGKKKQRKKCTLDFNVSEELFLCFYPYACAVVRTRLKAIQGV